MFKMSFRRIYHPNIYNPTGGYTRYPISPLDDSIIFFYIDIIEGKNSSFIIYGDYSNKSLKLKFKKFSNSKDLHRTTTDMVEERCEECKIDFNPLDKRDVFVTFTREEFKQNYLSRSWYYNNGIIYNYLVETAHEGRDLRGTTSNYSDVISYLDATLPSKGRIAIKQLSDLTPSIFDSLSDTDKSYLSELLKGTSGELNLTDNAADIAKIYLQNPLFGRF